MSVAGSSGMSAPIAREDREIVPLAAPLQRVVLAQRMSLELIRALRIRRRSGCPVKIMPNMS